MRQLRTWAIILRRTNYGEADRIINFITPNHGKVSGIAKGIRRPKSRLAGSLELLAVCDVNITSGKSSSMGVVTSARLVEFYGDIVKDYDRMQMAYRFIKDVNRIAEMVSDCELYGLLDGALKYLNLKFIDFRLVELWFDLKIIDLLGRGVNLSVDQAGVNLAVDGEYEYDFMDNVFVERSGGKFNGNHIKFLRLVRVKSPDIVRQVSGVDVVLDDCLWLARSLAESA